MVWPVKKERKEEGDRLLRYGFREFANKKLVAKGQHISDAGVWFGTQKAVGLIAHKDVVVTVPHAAMPDMTFKVKYTGPLSAPVAKGAHVADLVITQGGTDQVVPLMAAEDVEKLSGFARIKAVFAHYVMGKSPAQ